ncbi:MAG: ATP-binding protein [Thermodesulfobacteriota bacterium]
MDILSKKNNRLVGRAMHDYRMLADGDRVLVAVSGGVDSLFLVRLLDQWRHKAPIRYDLLAVHLDMGFDETSASRVAEQLNRFPVPFLIDHWPLTIPAEDLDSCFHCARQRRNRLFDLAATHGCNKIAFGHHKEDLLETLFLNLCYAGNISTMVPRQELFAGRLALIRPMAYLEKRTIVEAAARLGIEPVANPCPISADNHRQKLRDWLTTLYQLDPVIKGNMFAALANVRHDYLLTPAGKDHGADHP